MKATYSILLGFCLACTASTIGCQKPVEKLQPAELIAWCIVPFDSLDRSPAERMAMLKDLGLKRYAYDWRTKHLDTMAEELRTAKEAGIEVSAVWLWIDDDEDTLDSLSANNRRMLKILKDSGLKTDIWVSFHEGFFKKVHRTARVALGSKMIGQIADQAEAMGCRLALYNHGDWFGDPLNQIAIIDKLNRDIGLIYNFHHAHDQLDGYPDLMKKIQPYLWVVNLNGMVPAGPKIMPIGSGTKEEGMVQTLIDLGYDGDFGILGHVEEADVHRILDANLKGPSNLNLSN